MPVQMELSRVYIREMTDMQIIELTELGGQRSFPIVIGLPEASAIERRLKGVSGPRPQTHDLLSSLLEALGGRLVRIVIDDLSAGTFIAKIVIEQGGKEIEVDARPSDAIAFGIAEQAPIFVEERVLESALDNSALKDTPPELFDDDSDDDDSDDDLEDDESES